MISLLACAILGPTLLDYSISQWKTTPEMRIEDAYKWLFHATLGGEHAVTDDESPRRWLDREWPTVGRPPLDEPQTVRLRPDGRVIRVNLRPYKANGGDQEMLLAIFVASAKTFKGDKHEFVSEWGALKSRLQIHDIGKIHLGDWRRLDAITKPLGYPAIDHSREYERACSPAYRVVLGSLWSQ